MAGPTGSITIHVAMILALLFLVDFSTKEKQSEIEVKVIEVDEQQLLAQIIQRDKDDRERSLAPLKAATDAVVIDSSSQPAGEVVQRMYEKILATPCCGAE